MNCPNCNSTLPDEARFCGHCGTAIPSVIATETKSSKAPEDSNDSGGQASEPFTREDGILLGGFAASFLLVLSLFYAAGWDFWFVKHCYLADSSSVLVVKWTSILICLVVILFAAFLFTLLLCVILFTPFSKSIDRENTKVTSKQKSAWLGAYVVVDVALVVIAIAIRLAGVRHLPEAISEGVREKFESEFRNVPSVVHASASPLCNVHYEGDYVWTADVTLTGRILKGSNGPVRTESATARVRITAGYEHYKWAFLKIISHNP